MKTNKELYAEWCETTYVPIYSKPWWMDAICGAANWDVWLYKRENDIYAAMPYYLEKRGTYNYITKAPLTQSNGLLFKYPINQKKIGRVHQNEKISGEAQEFINALQLDVYEQQFHYSFQDFLPWFWAGYQIIPRITYVIEDVEDININISSKCKNMIRKGRKSISKTSSISPEKFFEEHEKIYLRQGLQCPFSFELWLRLYHACKQYEAGEIFTAQDTVGNVLSVAFLVWDSQSTYLLMGGNNPAFSSLQTYSALIYECIMISVQKGLKFDFEGSVIKRINHAYREFGGIPKTYYRIRKVFNKEIAKAEFDKQTW